MSTDKKIRCESCNKIIAEGQTPAVIIINCHHCGARNDLEQRSDTRPFAERLNLEKKSIGPVMDYHGCITTMIGIPAEEYEAASKRFFAAFKK